MNKANTNKKQASFISDNNQTSILPKEKKIILIRDTREQKPFNFPDTYTLGKNEFLLQTENIELLQVEGEVEGENNVTYSNLELHDKYVDYLIAIKNAKLQTGDYTIMGREKYMVLERKTLTDLAGCVFKPRFSDCINRLIEFPYKAIVVESGYIDVLKGNYEARVGPGRLLSYINSLQCRGLPVHLCGDRQTAMELSLHLLFTWDSKIG